MGSGIKCRECGSVIPLGSPGEFCGRCLLRLGLAHEPASPEVSGGGDSKDAPETEDTGRGFLEFPVPDCGPAGTVLVSPPLTEKPGDKIGRYKLLQKIGEGGWGVVYMAEQEEPVRRRVALKVIKLGMDTKQVVARFEAERQALALMDHPNIAKVLDAGATEAGRPYFVMELVRGIRITDYCDQNKLPTSERLKLFTQVCQAIQHAHQKGIIHRDIKPSNILVTLHDGVPVPKVIDFGIAKATQGRLTDQTLFTAFEQFIGTPAYMSPEQVEMSGLDIDTRSDIYSLGVLLYELLVGATPFAAEELLSAGIDQMRRVIREQDPVRPSTRLSTMVEGELTTTAKHRQTDAPKLIHLVRGDLDWIVMKCLEKDRTRRYETANGLARDIERHLGNEPVTARPPSSAYRFQKFVRRNKVIVTAAAVVAAALVLGVLTSSWEAVRATREAVRATKAEREQIRLAGQALAQERATRLRAYASEMGEALHALQDGDVQHVRELLEAQRPGRDQADLRGFEWRYLWGQSRTQEVFTLDLKFFSYGCAVSPDGRYLASGAGNSSEIQLWDLTARQLIVQWQVSPSGATDDLDFDPQSKILATTHAYQNCIRLWNLETLQPMEPVLHVANNANGVSFSRDGRWLATAAGLRYGDGVPGEAKIWDTATRTVRTVLPGVSDWLTRVKFSPDGRWVAASGGGGFVKAWEAATGREVKQLKGLRGIVFGLCFSPNGEILAAADSLGMIRFWKVGSWEDWLTFRGHERLIHRIAFSPDGRRLASASMDQTLKLWDPRNGDLLDTLRGHSQRVTSLSFLPTGSLLASSSLDGTVKLWNALATHEGTTFKGHKASWNVRVEFSPNGRWLAMTTNVPGTDPLVLCTTVWDTTTHQPITAVAGHPFKFAPDSTLATKLSDSTLALWQIQATGAVERLRLAAESKLSDSDSFAFSRDSSFLAARGPNQIVIWPLQMSPVSPKTIRRDGLGNQGGLLFSADGQTLIVAVDSEGLLECWDFRSMRRVGEMRDGRRIRVSGSVEALALSSDGRALATAGPSGVVQLWDLSSRTKLREFRHRGSGVGPMAFSPDGKTLVGGTIDGRLHFWNVASGSEIAALAAHVSSCRSISFSPDGRCLATAEVADMIKVWPAPDFEETDGPFSLPDKR